MNKWLVSVSVALIFASGALQAAGDVAAGKAKSAVCMACHGPDGNSPNPIWPNLAGQHANYIMKQLGDFKSGSRSNPLMSPMAGPLTDADVENLAAYFSSQAMKGGEAAADKVDLGRQIYQAGNLKSGVAACMACHGPSGAGNAPANFPRVAGQHAGYLEQALKDFRSAVRSNDVNGMMQGVAANMSDDEIAAVAQYIQGLR
jgi:cytochrome c553